MKRFKIIHDDNIKTLRSMEEKSVDMIFIDPPYNMQLNDSLKRHDGSEYDGMDEEWDKFDSISEYEEMAKLWISESLRVLKDDGSIWIMGSFHNIYTLGSLIQKMGLWIINDIIWEKTNPTPNFLGTKFCNAHEILIWFKKDKDSKFTFNYHTMKMLNGGKQDRSVWRIPICSGNERLTDHNGNKLHKSQKPLELIDKVILSSTKRDDLILDIFSGTATTGASALRYGRRYIGIEIDDKMIKPSIKRLEEVELSDNKLLVDNLLDIKPPQVRIEKLISDKYIIPNEAFYNKDKSVAAKIDKDGKISIDNKKYSIHKSSAKLLNKKTSNGWDYWYVIRDDKLVSIDDIRKKYRKDELGFEEVDLEKLKKGTKKG